MINLDRRKNHKWIMQKNINSDKIIKAYVNAISNLNNNNIDYDLVKKELKANNLYRGRSCEGSLSTMGVRFSEMCFYMFGYKYNKKTFVPSPMTLNMLNPECPLSMESNMLVNLFSIQFPHPYSKTNEDFCLYAGRLIVNLLLDDRIERKLYIDEIIWFLPFIDTITQDIYEELISSIQEYRNLSYTDKLLLFHSINNYDDVFANVCHEMNYYFIRIFEKFGVFETNIDINHNDGHIFVFHHGRGDTKRNDAINSREKHSGYIKLAPKVVSDAGKLKANFPFYEKPTTMKSDGIYTLHDWLTSLYDTEPLSYLNCLSYSNVRQKEISNIVQNMLHSSKYGSRDGKDFESSLKPIMELFREARDVEIISGSGNTDLLCSMEDNNDQFYKINVDAKTRKVGLEEINANRLENHLRKHGSQFCIVVAPKFASGITGDIKNHNIVTIKAEILGSYCYKECLNSKDGYADFESLKNIILSNLGSDITENIYSLINQKYGISLANA